jgi:23S rRNA (adenine2030-N6)-methyltransferase
MEKSGAQYAHESKQPNYLHDFHAGNVGDVWKHVALCALLTDLLSSGGSLTVLDTHAGSGVYQLKSTGEWTEGIGRVYSAPRTELHPAIRRYLEIVQAEEFDTSRIYPGSPRFVQHLLGPQDRMISCDTDAAVVARLKDAITASDRLEIINGDGLEVLRGIRTKCGSGKKLFCLVDPPWSAKQDWTIIPQLVLDNVDPDICVMLWYPIKSYTRVAAMQKQVESSGAAACFLDLITTPLEYQRNRLNGSGLLLFNPPQKTVSDLAAVAAQLGPICAIKDGFWQIRITRTGAPSATAGR